MCEYNEKRKHKISLTLEVSPNDLQWLSKLFSIMAYIQKRNSTGGLSPEGKILEEIKKFINKSIESKKTLKCSESLLMKE